MSPVGTIFVPFPPKTGGKLLHPRPHQMLNGSQESLNRWNVCGPSSEGSPRNEKADADGSAASSVKARKSAHYVHPGQAFFGKRSYKVTTVAAESFERLGKSGTEFVDQLVAGVAGGANGGNLRRKGVMKERLQHHVSVIAQVIISRRVEWYRLALDDFFFVSHLWPIGLNVLSY